ncbi:MAG TPA: hypothetical protein V6C65_15445, partial [Allocoleopsis sp.]
MASHRRADPFKAPVNATVDAIRRNISGHHTMSRYNRPITLAEQKLYDHLLYWIELESPDSMIDRFRHLFIDGVGYPDAEIAQALKTVASSPSAAEDFRFVLNRCCHILINRWQSRSHSQLAIPELVNVFCAAPAPSSRTSHLRSVRHLHQLVKEFTQTEQYLTLRRLAQVLSEAAETAHSVTNRPLGTLIRRYPYLYEHCLLSEDSAQEQQSTVRLAQANVQRQFEINLSQYVTYQVRRSQLIRVGAPEPPVMRPVSNPTLLSDRELGSAIKHYVGRVEGNRTHKDLAQTFQVHVSHPLSFATFKDDLYEYITA